jgi:hypothetical protein
VEGRNPELPDGSDDNERYRLLTSGRASTKSRNVDGQERETRLQPIYMMMHFGSPWLARADSSAGRCAWSDG